MNRETHTKSKNKLKQETMSQRKSMAAMAGHSTPGHRPSSAHASSPNFDYRWPTIHSKVDDYTHPSPLSGRPGVRHARIGVFYQFTKFGRHLANRLKTYY